jgi:AraC-like DNA-binding protein
MMEAHKVKSELPLVRLNLVLPLLNELERHRIESQQVLAEFNLTRQTVIQSDMFVPAPTMYAIVEELAAISGDPHFGIRVGEQLDPWSWYPLSDAAALSATVGEFLLRFLMNATRDESSVTYILETVGNRSSFHSRRFTDGGLQPRHNDGFTIAYLLNVLRKAAGERWDGSKVLARLCDPGVVPRGYYGIRLAVSDTLGPSISFPSEWLIWPIKFEQATAPSRRKATDHPPATLAPDAFQQALQPHIHEFNLTSERVAEICGLNKRTLARKLQTRGTSVTQVLAEMRRTLAEKELINSDRHVAEIAAMVGYLDPSVFSRAFKRWTGVSPREFRKQSHI